MASAEPNNLLEESRSGLSAIFDSKGVTITGQGRTIGPFPSLDEINVVDSAKELGVEPKELLEFKFGISNRELKVKGLLEVKDSKIDPDKYFDNGHFVPAWLGDELLKSHHFATLRDTREVYIYQEGVYRPLGEAVILEETQKALRQRCKNTHKNEVLGYIQAATFIDRKEFDKDPSLIGLRNGVYSLVTEEFSEHDPHNKITIQLPIEYDPRATCPNFLKFLNEVLPDDTERQAIIECIGYCLYRSYPIQKAFMLVGEGSNGKSTLLLVLKALLGSDNITSRSLHDLEENRFAMAALYGKLANIFPDLPAKTLTNTSVFKMLTGGDPLTAEKKFRDEFNYINYAKLIFSTNQIPISQDDTSAFYRRWIIINFPNKFEGEQCDPNILAKLTTPEELSGIFNLAVKALGDLMARSAFINNRNTSEIAEEYIRRSDSVQAFIKDCVESSTDGRVKKQEVYATYLTYCRLKNYPIVNDQSFYKRFLMHMRIEETRSSELGRPRIWIGLRLNKPQEDVAMSDLSNMSTQNPTLCEIQQKTTKMENRVDKLDTLDKKTTSKLLCGTCFKTKGYETMTDIERKGIVSEGICADCGSPAELLIQLKESSWGGGDIF